MANVPATKLQALKLAKTLRGGSSGGGGNLGVSMNLPAPKQVQVPTDKRQPSARVKALRAISARQQL